MKKLLIAALALVGVTGAAVAYAHFVYPMQHEAWLRRTLAEGLPGGAHGTVESVEASLFTRSITVRGFDFEDPQQDITLRVEKAHHTRANLLTMLLGRAEPGTVLGDVAFEGAEGTVGGVRYAVEAGEVLAVVFEADAPDGAVPMFGFDGATLGPVDYVGLEEAGSIAEVTLGRFSLGRLGRAEYHGVALVDGEGEAEASVVVVEDLDLSDPTRIAAILEIEPGFGMAFVDALDGRMEIRGLRVRDTIGFMEGAFETATFTRSSFTIQGMEVMDSEGAGVQVDRIAVSGLAPEQLAAMMEGTDSDVDVVAALRTAHFDALSIEGFTAGGRNGGRIPLDLEDGMLGSVGLRFGALTVSGAADGRLASGVLRDLSIDVDVESAFGRERMRIITAVEEISADGIDLETAIAGWLLDTGRAVDVTAVQAALFRPTALSSRLTGVDVSLNGTSILRLSRAEGLVDETVELDRIGLVGRAGSAVMEGLTMDMVGLAELAAEAGNTPPVFPEEFAQVVIGARSEWTWDDATGESSVGMTFDAENVGALALSFRAAGLDADLPTRVLEDVRTVPFEEALIGTALRDLALAEFAFGYRDSGLFDILLTQFAIKEGVDKETMRANLAQFALFMAIGAGGESEAMRQAGTALGAFVMEPGRLQVALAPRKPMRLAELIAMAQAGQSQRLVQELGLAVTHSP